MIGQEQVDGLRYQDAVARTSGVDLKTTVRVLRALQMVAKCNHDFDLEEGINSALLKSAVNAGDAAELDSKPRGEAVDACDKVFNRIIKRFSWERVRALQRLEGGCPFYASVVTDEVFAGKHD